jgi:hypothetical protein
LNPLWERTLARLRKALEKKDEPRLEPIRAPSPSTTVEMEPTAPEATPAKTLKREYPHFY